MSIMARTVRVFLLMFVPTLIFRLASNSPWIQSKVNSDALLFVIGLLIAIALVFEFFGFLKRYRQLGPNAVEVFLLTEDAKICLYKHPHHKVMLPPGGRLGRFEPVLPGLQRSLKDRLGLSPADYTLLHMSRVKQSSSPKEGVEPVPCPFRVQMEHRTQRGKMAFHTDFIFAANIHNPELINPAPQYKPAAFYDIDTVRDMVGTKETFADVYDAFKNLLDIQLTSTVK